jgi:hypothetical protein
VIDVYLNGTRADTIKVENPISPRSAIAITSSLANLNATRTCAAVAVRVVVDSENVLADGNRTNNEGAIDCWPAKRSTQGLFSMLSKP